MARKPKNVLVKEQFIHISSTPANGSDALFFNLASNFTGGYNTFEEFLDAIIGDDETARIRKMFGQLSITAQFSIPSVGNWVFGLLATTTFPATSGDTSNCYDLESILDVLCTNEYAVEVIASGIIGVKDQLVQTTYEALTQTIYTNRTFKFSIDCLSRFGGIKTDNFKDYPEGRTIPFILIEGKDNLAGSSCRVDGHCTIEFDVRDNDIRTILETP